MRTIAFVLMLSVVAPLTAQAPPSYRITHSYVVGGDGSWDYIVPDPPTQRRDGKEDQHR